MDGSCQLFTVLGAAGVGKSRLSYEFLDGLADVTVVRGTCLSYGEGITYWPVVEILKQLLGPDPSGGSRSSASTDGVSRALQAVLGEGGAQTSKEEIAWAVRRLLEAEAEHAPLVAVLDDIHWGEDAFLDLVDHVADLSRDAPILLLCMARPELLDRRPNWGGGKLNATTVLLEPLAAADAEALVESLLEGAQVDHGLRGRILDAAEGNPLFVQEMVGLLKDSPDASMSVPPTIQALLAARLDQLDPTERGVLERGSVEGRVFHRGAVQALSPTEDELRTPLTALVRRELVRPDRPQFAGEDAYRFRHLLIRDAAYDALPKATRADLHERFATGSASTGRPRRARRGGGYHLERAYRYRVELGPAGAEAEALAARAAARLAAAGGRAVNRGDMRAAEHLFGRAESLYDGDDPARLALLPRLGRVLQDMGDWDRARTVLGDALARSRATGDRRVGADAAVALAHLEMFTEVLRTHDEVRELLAEPVRVFESLGDEAGLARAFGLAGQLRFWAGDSAAAIVDLERAAEHARRAGDLEQESHCLNYVLIASVHGATPVDEANERCAQIGEQLAGDRRMAVTVLRCRINLEAMAGRFAEARALAAEAAPSVAELGLELAGANVSFEAGHVELYAGDPVAAERVMRPGLELLERIGNHGHWVTAAMLMADALLAQDRAEEAEALADQAEAWAMKEDLDPQIGRRRIKARVLALRGEYEEAERLAREAVELGADTDYLEDDALHACRPRGGARARGAPGQRRGRRSRGPGALRAEAVHRLDRAVASPARQVEPVPGTEVPGTGLRPLLELDRGAGLFELALDLVGLLLVHALLDGLGARVDEVLGLLEAEAGDRADDLDHLDLLSARAVRTTSKAVFSSTAAAPSPPTAPAPPRRRERRR